MVDEHKGVLSDQIAKEVRSAQAAETKLAECENRYKAQAQELIKSNLALTMESQELEAAYIARLALAQTGQQLAKSQLAETLRQRDETVNQTEATKYLIILKAANRYLNDETVLIFEGRPTKISLFAFCFYIYQDALFRQTTKYITQ